MHAPTLDLVSAALHPLIDSSRWGLNRKGALSDTWRCAVVMKPLIRMRERESREKPSCLMHVASKRYAAIARPATQSHRYTLYTLGG